VSRLAASPGLVQRSPRSQDRDLGHPFIVGELEVGPELSDCGHGSPVLDRGEPASRVRGGISCLDSACDIRFELADKVRMEVAIDSA
jgi:hypothetical protein